MSSQDVFKSRERIPTSICATDHEAIVQVAAMIIDLIKRRNAERRPTVLGLATGHTPVGVYRELIRAGHGGLDFSHVITYNLDEYYPMPPDSLQSYHRWMRENLFDHINIDRKHIHIPDGTVARDSIEQYCGDYEKSIAAAGGIDIQLLGIGRTGHIGFNEPGSSVHSRTRLITLDPVTRRDAAADFFGEANVPREAITMGVGTILDAKQVILLAFGEQKAPIIKQTVEGPVTDAVPATYLQQHPSAHVFADGGSAGELTRYKTPWLLGEPEWTEQRAKQAVIWLSQTCRKSILKLDREDYDLHGLAPLLRRYPTVDVLNRKIFRALQATIKGHTDLPHGRTILVFSPHPDDDVISMGGTIRKLVENQNRLHVAYMTSGNIAVFDDDALMLAELVADLDREFGFAPERARPFAERVRSVLAAKQTGQPDAPEVQKIKTWIRRSEARAACKHMGIPAEGIHFLELPFYQTGVVRKLPIGERDIQTCHQLLEQVRPDWVFLAGELSDPHGTHRLCADAVFAALRESAAAKAPFVPETVWLYRGAWQEWEPERIDMAVHLTRDELTNKIFGIFKHESQKDKALFPGPYDDREFWQRAEARNRHTAEVFDQLGLPEYYAMEAFVGWSVQ
ncbi:MAG TPA: glucosamine-6-phosphate deaminase [Phycisphaerae bacterium]|jgi:glucosamine-6-phosphate deaminase